MESESFAEAGKSSAIESYSNGTCLKASCPTSGNSVAAIESKEANRLIRCGMARAGASQHVNPLEFADASLDTARRFSGEALQLPSTTKMRLMQSILEGQFYFR